MYPVNIELESRVVHILRNINLPDAMDLANASGQTLSDVINLVQIRAADLHVNWRGHSHVKNRVYHRAAGKERSNFRKLARHCLLHTVHILEAAEFVRIV